MTSSFVTGHRWDRDWEDDTELLTLGNGVRVKVFRQDTERGRLDVLVWFPPGYVEPAHAHDSEHSIVVLEGEQVVGSARLRAGDYCYAGREEIHGPFAYPEGCVVFASFTGVSAQHRYPGSPGGEIGHA
jgi:anti-sigma factor ChrR (cupin superfamily)